MILKKRSGIQIRIESKRDKNFWPGKLQRNNAFAEWKRRTSEGMKFHNRISGYTGDLWATVKDRFGKINRREQLRKEKKYLPEPNLEKNWYRVGGRVHRKAEYAK